MGATKADVEGAMLATSLLAFVGYNAWLIQRPRLARACGGCCGARGGGRRVADIFAAGKARPRGGAPRMGTMGAKAAAPIFAWLLAQLVSRARGGNAGARASPLSALTLTRASPLPPPSSPPTLPPLPPKLGRVVFTESVCADPKDSILAVQQARNAMSASTYLASISSVLATAGAIRVGARFAARIIRAGCGRAPSDGPRPRRAASGRPRRAARPAATLGARRAPVEGPLRGGRAPV
jgi:hypothetical protein